MSEQSQDTIEQTDYEAAPVYLDEADEVEGLNITLDDGSATDELERSWFFIHCYSGYEKKVEHALRQRIETMGMQDQIYDVLIPTEDEIEVKDGKRRTVEKRVFPGYVMVQMRWNNDEEELDKDAWYTVRNTPGVVGFVGLFIPHAVRSLVGNDSRTVMAVSIPVGALVVLYSDQISRLAFMPSEIPVGLITTVLGAPVMIWVARRVL